MRRKNPSRFPIPVKVGLKEARPGLASFALSFVQIGKREGFFLFLYFLVKSPVFLKSVTAFDNHVKTLHCFASFYVQCCVHQLEAFFLTP